MRTINTSFSFEKKVTKIAETEIQAQAEAEQWRLRQTVGKYGTFIILSGAIIIPFLLALLVVLWAGGNGGDGANGTREWRFIVLNGWFTETVTLLSMGINTLTGLQSLICTSLSAAVILETAGVPVSQVAEISMMRGVNDGPWRLVFMTMTSSSLRRIFSLQSLLVFVLYIGTVATQFGSTILVTDLETKAIVGNANETYYNLTISTAALRFQPLPVLWFVPPEYSTFAEMPPSHDVTPSSQGFSDTGNVRRFYLPLSRDNITKTRGFEGAAYGWNSRVSCAPPLLKGQFNTTLVGRATLPYVLSFKGNISYEETFAKAGLPPISTCTEGRCLPQNFNCTLVVASNVGKEGISFCAPGVDNVLSSSNSTGSAGMKWLSDPRKDPINAHSMVFLMSKTNGTHFNWSSQAPTLPQTATRNGEWMEWTLKNNTKYSATICFVSSVWERSNIKASTTRDTFVGKPQEQPGRSYDTELVRKQLGATNTRYSNTERGIFTVDSIANTTWGTNNTLYLDTSTYYLFGGGQKLNGYNFVMHTSTGGSGITSVNPYMDFSGILEDVLVDTGRPALALQAMLGMKAYNTWTATSTHRINPEAVHVTETVMTQAPVRWRGLLCFAAVVVLNYLCVIAITATFLLRTRYSKQGHFWHTVSQVITEDTIPLLQHASESRDDHAMARSCLGSGTTRAADDNLDPVVVVARSTRTGRVQIIRRDKLGRA